MQKYNERQARLIMSRRSLKVAPATPLRVGPERPAPSWVTGVEKMSRPEGGWDKGYPVKAPAAWRVITIP